MVIFILGRVQCLMLVIMFGTFICRDLFFCYWSATICHLCLKTFGAIKHVIMALVCWVVYVPRHTIMWHVIRILIITSRDPVSKESHGMYGSARKHIIKCLVWWLLWITPCYVGIIWLELLTLMVSWRQKIYRLPVYNMSIDIVLNKIVGIHIIAMI
jgi:hypothetical protein